MTVDIESFIYELHSDNSSEKMLSEFLEGMDKMAFDSNSALTNTQEFLEQVELAKVRPCTGLGRLAITWGW
jgi:hypothetical protein